MSALPIVNGGARQTGLRLWFTLPVLLLLTFAMVHRGSAQEATDSGGAAANDAPRIVPRVDQIMLFPCTQCHQFLPPNPEIRTLMAPHVAELAHGDGRIWCLNCHNSVNRDQLVNLLNEPASFDEAPRICSSCHAARYRDWQLGAHGKRAAQWQGERVVYSCSHCHDPHAPAIKPRAPQPPPPVRRGLERPEPDTDTHQPAWAGRALEPAP